MPQRGEIISKVAFFLKFVSRDKIRKGDEISESIFITKRSPKNTVHNLSTLNFTAYPSVFNKQNYNPAVIYAASQHQGRFFWIVCKRPAFLIYFSQFQLIQNLAPSVAGMRQCDIRIYLVKTPK